uniref:ATPase PAAT isoform X2 n=1 Tax=Jaculus jaculus TaxID=51337 RepID=UPI001E1B0D67|nr:ATPase PAAT isoform X2 [Jaculus jaculus]
MEPGSGDAGGSCGPTLTSSWEAARGLLTRSLHVTRNGLGAHDPDWEELLAPPAAGRELVSLKSSRSPPDEKPCFLHLRCAPNGGEEILSIGILSSARNMEVYLEEEYGGTSRGKSVCTVLDDSEHGKILLYKNHIKLESSTHACKIKLLSFGEKQCVFISKVVAHVRPSSAHSSPSCPMLGSRLDLDNIQSIMESMGSKLSPGAQQLMDMIRCQQKSCIPIREQLQSVLGTTGYKHMVALQLPSAPGALDKSSSTPFPFRSVLTSSSATENSKPFTEESTQPPGGNGHTTNQSQRTIVPPNHSLLENDLKNAVSFFPKKASDTPEVPHSELLPFLQNLCSQVNHLRIGHNAKWQENISKPQEGIVSVAMEEQPIYSYLEKILSKNMELMEKKLMDYIDQRVCKLQEHMDAKIDLLMGMLQNPSSPPPGMPLIHYDSREKLSNGER